MINDDFFAIIRRAIFSKFRDFEIPRFRGTDWKEVLTLCEEHKVTGVVANAIMNLPEGVRPENQEMQDWLVTQVVMHQMMRQQIQEVIVEVFEALEARGIKAILMKGESMVRFYPENCHRGIGDIDLLVPEGRYREAVAVLQELSGDMGYEDSTERHYDMEFRGFKLEIHPRPIWCANPAHKGAWMMLSMEYADPERCEMIMLQGHAIRTFAMPYNVLFIFNHLLEHLRDGGIGFKQVLDWMLMLSNPELQESENSKARKLEIEKSRNLERAGAMGVSEVSNFRNFLPEASGRAEREVSQLEFQLKRCGLLRAWKVMGGILVKNLGLPEERFPLYEERWAVKSQGKILTRMVHGGLFGFYGRAEERHRPTPLRVLHNMIYVLKDMRYLWTLFPDGALASGWGIVWGSLRNHAGFRSENRVFSENSKSRN